MEVSLDLGSTLQSNRHFMHVEKIGQLHKRFAMKVHTSMKIELRRRVTASCRSLLEKTTDVLERPISREHGPRVPFGKSRGQEHFRGAIPYELLYLQFYVFRVNDKRGFTAISVLQVDCTVGQFQ